MSIEYTEDHIYGLRLLIFRSLIPFVHYSLQKEWSEGHQLANLMNFKFPQFTAIALESIVTNACSEGVTFLTELLYWNPNNRPTTTSALRHSYFRNFGTGHRMSGQSNGSAVKANLRPSQTQPEDRATQKLHHQQKQEQFKNNSNHDDVFNYSTRGSIGKSVSTGNFNSSIKKDESIRNNEESSDKSQKATASRVSANSITRNSIKDQYLNRSRYITAQSSAVKSSNPFNSTGSSMDKV